MDVQHVPQELGRPPRDLSRRPPPQVGAAWRWPSLVVSGRPEPPFDGPAGHESNVPHPAPVEQGLARAAGLTECTTT